MAYMESIPMQLILSKAQAGDAEAQYQVGLRYLYGDAQTEPDYIEGIVWLHKAAGASHKEALNQLAEICTMVQRRKEADAWRSKAAEQDGDPMLQQEIAEDLECQGKFEEALEWYKKSAAGGNMEAAYDVQRLTRLLERRKQM